MSQPVPFLDLVTPHCEMEEEILSAVRSALRTGMFIGGPSVEGFEAEFAAFTGSAYCVGVGSGTDALRFALIAAGVKPGDVVITVPNTFIATTEAISQAGASIAFVDVEERTLNMDPDRLRAFLTGECVRDDKGRTIHRASGRPVTALIPVHLYGQMADMDRLQELAEEHGLMVIEDACQAHGAEYFSQKENRWRKAGSIGKAAAFSFYPGKNLGACGEAGAITTDDEKLARHVRTLRDHGQVKKYVHSIEGYNGRLDAIQAAILRIKLRRLADGNEQRRKNAARYDSLLSGMTDIAIPYRPDWSRPVFHLYVIRTGHRDALQAFLSARGIGTGLHYPVPLHLQPAYASSGLRQGDFPNAERAAGKILSLPMFPGLTEEQQMRVVEAIAQFRPAPRPSARTAAVSA